MILFMLTLLAVTAAALNRGAGMQARMGFNQAASMQFQMDRLAVIEDSIWRLTQNPALRTGADGEDFTCNGSVYSRKILSSTVSGFTDSVLLSVKRKDELRPLLAGLRYYIDTPVMARKPDQIYRDAADNIYFADTDNHSVWKVDTTSGAIVRVAGTGASGFSGDGGPAVQARLDSPQGVSGDSSGSIYIADTRNNRVRKVDPFGYISTIAGDGTAGDSGDNGPAASARLNRPHAVFVDSAGNVFISDTESNKIRKMNAASPFLIQTVAGTGAAGYNGDGIAAATARLNHPEGIYVNAAGELFIADSDNHRIRKVSAASPFNISTVAGNGQSGYLGDGVQATSTRINDPHGVFVDTSGNILIADTDNHRVRRVNTSGVIATVAGTGVAGYSGDGGAATGAELDGPRSACVKSNGEVVISDTMNNSLRKFAPGGSISTIPATGRGLNAPGQITLQYSAADSRYYLYIADRGNHRIRKLDTVTGVVSTVAGSGIRGSWGDGFYAVWAHLDSPRGVHVDQNGNIFIADTENHRVRKVDAGSGIISTVAGTGSSGDSGDGGWAVFAKLDDPRAVHAAASGSIYIADTDNHRIRRVSSGGIITTVAGNGLPGSTGDGGSAASARLNTPEGIWLDGSGNLYIADTSNHKIRRVDGQSGVISTVAGSGVAGYAGDGGSAASAHLNYPRSVFIDGSGNLYIADTMNHVIRMVRASDSVIVTIAGQGNSGFDYDNQPAVTSRLNWPAGIAPAQANGAGRIYVSDTDNNRIRVVFWKKIREF